ncbi:MAG: [protein-PII] uridylyltransferase [Candidatus Hydrogenedentes bacterium]|nr:[protein-PII] uridylyltransferase [Candidatus Hydrogenedentota bacterium]
MTTSFQELVEQARNGEHGFCDLRREECLAATRDFAATRRAEIRKLHTDSASGSDVVHMLADVADEIVHGIYHFALSCLPTRRSVQSRIALCAFGGYGRSELSPFSDLDISLIYEGQLDEGIRALNGYLIPFLWDSGFAVGYSIHSVREARDLASEDLVTFTRMLEGRIIDGESAVYARLKLFIRELQSGELAQRFIEHKIRDRYEMLEEDYRDLYDAEPNVKESAGGLRDFHTALWLLMMSYGISTLDEAVGQGIISSDEHLDFVDGLDFIWRCRNEMHFHAGKADDRLTYAHQRNLARAFGYGDHMGVSRFLQDYYAAAGRLRRFLRIAARVCNYSNSASLPDAGMPVAQEYVIENNEIYVGVGDKNWFAHTPSRLMEVFWICARHRAPLSRNSERLVADNLHLVNDAFRSNDVVRRFFLAICNKPLTAGFALRQASSIGLLDAYLPEFASVQKVIRYEDFHSYPVGEHTLRAIDALNEMTNVPGAVGRCLREALENLADPNILVMAILFHDLGKAAGDIHVDESVRITHEICQRIGVQEDDEERIAFLVQHHVLMTNISQYRDIDDEDIVRDFAETMKNEQRLRALFILSYADLSAVGPGVWNEWKGALLLQLYLRTVKRLLGRAESPDEDFWNSPKAQAVVEHTRKDLCTEIESHLRGLGQRYFVAFQPEQIAMHLECADEARRTGLAVRCQPNQNTGLSDVVICTADRHGLFSKIAGCFSSQLIDINGAALFTRPDGMVVDCFSVCDAKYSRPLTSAQTARVAQVLRSVLLDGEDVQEHVDRSLRRLYALLQPRVPVPTKVEFDNSSSRNHTIIDIETGDRTGLLYDITRAMSEAGLDIVTARIVTDARRVRDSFYVTRNTSKIEDEETQAAIREMIHSAIHPRAAVEAKGGRA